MKMQNHRETTKSSRACGRNTLVFRLIPRPFVLKWYRMQRRPRAAAFRIRMVGVAQLAERQTVALVVVGSNPIAHPRNLEEPVTDVTRNVTRDREPSRAGAVSHQ